MSDRAVHLAERVNVTSGRLRDISPYVSRIADIQRIANDLDVLPTRLATIYDELAEALWAEGCPHSHAAEAFYAAAEDLRAAGKPCRRAAAILTDIVGSSGSRISNREAP